MKRFTAVLALLVLCISVLASCGSTSDVPSGLQVAWDNASDGYVFYAPENWKVSTRDGVSLAFVSGINNTSVSFTKAEKPEGTLDDYVKASIATLDGATAEAECATLTVSGERCTFGNTDNAYKYIYTYGYGTKEVDGEKVPVQYTTMQIFVTRGEDFFIFTYNALGAPDDAQASYQLYISYAQRCIDGFKFKDKSDVGGSADKEYVKDKDGYILISEKKLCGFDLYVPESYEVVDSSAIVSARINDSANVIVAEARETGVDIYTYWENRKAELMKSADKITEIAVNKTNIKGEDGAYTTDVKLGNLAANAVASYEYTYERGGVVYHVYQILGWTRDHGYVFTYTATEDAYSVHLDEVMTVIEKLGF